MGNPELNLKPSGVAAVECVTEVFVHRLVYFQQIDGYLYEAEVWDPLDGQDLTTQKNPTPKRLVQAWLGTQLAATASQDLSEVSLYYLNPDGILSELSHRGDGWKSSPLPGNPLPSTSIAAITRNRGPNDPPETLVFAQSVDLNIYVLKRDAPSKPWKETPKINTLAVYPATGIAAVIVGDSKTPNPNPDPKIPFPDVRVYYTSRLQRLIELIPIQNKWQERVIDRLTVPGLTGLAATKQSKDGPGAYQTFVYFFNFSGIISRALPDGQGVQMVVDPKGIVGWKNSLAAIFLSRTEADTLIFFQLDKDYNFSELIIRDGSSVGIVRLPF